jgi:DNA-directed RNA polymerase subunit beta'
VRLNYLIPKTKEVLIVNNVPYGSFLYVKEKQKLKKDDKICSWDPYNAVILVGFRW